MVMRKISYLFMQINKEPKVTEYQKQQVADLIIKENNETDNYVGVDADLEDMDLFDEGIYDNKEPEQIAEEIKIAKENEEFNKLNMFGESVYDETVDTTDHIIKYPEVIVDKEFRVSRKEALTSVEIKSPFVVGKKNSKKTCIEDDDVLYKTVPKISFREGRRAKVIGYVRADKKVKKRKVHEKNIIGMLNYEFPVYKKEGFNRDLVGYIKSESDNLEYDTYIKVSKSNLGKKIMIFILMILLAFGISRIKLPEGWDFENMTLFLTEQNIIHSNINVSLVHDEVMIVDDTGVQFNIQLSGEEDLEAEFIIQDGDTVLCQSNHIPIEEAGNNTNWICITNKGDKGKYNCTMITKIYKADKYIGELKSEFELRIK